ncbi:DapH/DapD/GlmU-related protein [Paenibacillus solani]|uniref:acyltransferase n=1 Tax=Paenibacillus solani TaxID=1705565 RepID=UPI003D27A6D0
MKADSSIVYSDHIGSNVELRDYSIVYKYARIQDNVIIGEHSVIGRSATPTSVMKKELSKIKETIIHEGVSICSNVIIYEDVIIGKGSLIGDNSSIMPNVNIGEEVLISRGVNINTEVTIGNNTRIMDNSHITGRVSIGNNVFISVGVTMANDNLFGLNGYDDKVSGATIEDYVSVGVGSIILPGVRIGKGSIVAAGSVIKKDVPDYVIVAGNPAKIVSKVPSSMRRN